MIYVIIHIIKISYKYKNNYIYNKYIMSNSIKTIKLSENEYKLRKNRIYYNIPFKDKDEFKNLGGKWDAENKLWYFNGNNPNKNKISLKEITIQYDIIPNCNACNRTVGL